MTHVAHTESEYRELTEEQVRAWDRHHVFHSWSAQDEIAPLPIASARGSTFTDYSGKTYLDFSSQLVYTNLGHQHPRLVSALQRQAEKLATIAPGFANDARAELAHDIAEIAPEGMDYVFFTNGGADANEYAIRLAQQVTGRAKVLSAYRSYHGATGTMIGVSGDPRRWGAERGGHTGAESRHFFGPYLYRSAFWSQTPEEETQRALQHLENLIVLEGPETIAAIILESVVGTNGILVPPPGYLPGVRELCDRYGICYIADEVMAGFGRTGQWFGFENFGVAPDLITFAKGVNSGYVPLGGVVMRSEFRDFFAHRPFPGGLTYSGHPLACAVGVESMRVFREEGVLEHVRDLEERVMRPGLAECAKRHEGIGEFRGLGLFWAVELVRDRDTREPLVPFCATGEEKKPMAELAAACHARGLWPVAVDNRLHLTPPLTISEEELTRGLDILDDALSACGL
ncbi:aspartate aminotransferase family protein [Corynebacterium uropygiale]|uniref:aspartate aminotransferase family protein n=1 Tax=Corynebacterium uropygiale TaxID=1775911 RepID=UPI003B834E23